MGQSRWMLVATEGQFSGRSFTVPETGITFGREADNTMILDDEKISRRHAVLRLVEGQLVIEDLKSRNGTFVNNVKVTRQPLVEGDRIALGSSLFQIRPETENSQPLPKPEPEATIVSVRPRSALARTQAISVSEAHSPPTPNLAAPLVTSTGTGGAALSPVRETAPQATPGAGGGSAASLGGGGPSLAGSAASDATDAALLAERAANPSIFDEATGVLPSRAALEQALSGPGRGGMVALGGMEDPARLSGGALGAMADGHAPIFGGAAAAVALEPLPGVMPGALNGSPAGLQPLPMPAPLEPLGGSRSSGSRTGLIIAGCVLTVMILGVLGISLRGSDGNKPAPVVAPVPEGPSASSREMASMLAGDGAPPKSVLSPEEQALSPEEKKSRAQEVREQGDSLLASNKFKEARDEYSRALALDPDCQVCLLRLTRVQQDIKTYLERYRTDAVRAFQSMDYPTAQRNWQMVLELETDPASRQSAMDGLRQAKAQLQQQPYR